MTSTSTMTASGTPLGYAITDWGTTVRLLVVLAVLLGPAYLIVLASHPAWLIHLIWLALR